jgi:hypothetical protein
MIMEDCIYVHPIRLTITYICIKKQCLYSLDVTATMVEPTN